MDDFVMSNLRESKNEWCCYLVDILTPLITQGIRSMFQQAWTMCVDKNETNKYLMTFQNLLTLVSKWNSMTIEDEKKRIIEQSGCHYLEELIVCVHIIHLKVMTHIRVGNRQKKIDISLPKLDDFLHRVYINCARQIYKNVYLFEKGLEPLVQQKYNRELELIIQQNILTTVRDSIPKEQIIRSFMDENIEQEEEITIEPITNTGAAANTETKGGSATPNEAVDEKPLEIPEEPEIPTVPSIQNADEKPVVTQIKFNDYDSIFDSQTKTEENKFAPKTIERLEEISMQTLLKQKQEAAQAEEEDRVQLSNETLSWTDLGIEDLSSSNKPPVSKNPDDVLQLLDIQDF